jgi:hypothetical protein
MECCKPAGKKDLDHPQIEQISQILTDRICINRRNLRIGCLGLRPASRLLCRCAPRNDRGMGDEVIMQNKANLAAVGSTLTEVQERGYRETGGLGVRKDKANSWACSVPVRAVARASRPWKTRQGQDGLATETPHGVTTSGANRAKQSQFRRGQIDANCLTRKGLRQDRRVTRLRKQSQFAGPGLLPPPLRGQALLGSSQWQESGSRTFRLTGTRGGGIGMGTTKQLWRCQNEQ